MLEVNEAMGELSHRDRRAERGAAARSRRAAARERSAAGGERRLAGGSRGVATATGEGQLQQLEAAVLIDRG